MIDQKKYTYISWLIAIIGCIQVTAFYKVGYSVAPYVVCFGMHNALLPLSGLWAGLEGATSVFLISLFLRIMMHSSTFSLHYLAYIIPGYCASLYWVYSNAFIRFYLPLICMILFIVHPVGFYATPYTFYWIIPLVIYRYSPHSFFLHALASTFIAHAVGSVIWLYTVPMSAVQWYSLIPMVALERFCFALGMVMLYHSMAWVKKVALGIIKRAGTIENLG